jgi:hypothetical protein
MDHTPRRWKKESLKISERHTLPRKSKTLRASSLVRAVNPIRQVITNFKLDPLMNP